MLSGATFDGLFDVYSCYASEAVKVVAFRENVADKPSTSFYRRSYVMVAGQTEQGAMGQFCIFRVKKNGTNLFRESSSTQGSIFLTR